MVQQNIPTVLRIDRDKLRPSIPLRQVNLTLPELNTFSSLFSEDNFTAARVTERVNSLGAWNQPVIQDLDNEHQFEGLAPWGIDDDRPTDSLWKVYCQSLSRRYPNRCPLIISSPISLDNLPATFLTPEIHQRLPLCSNLLFILRNNLHEYWFGDLNFHTTTLHIFTPWPAGAVAIPDTLWGHGGLEQCLRVATRDPTCRISFAQSYSISTPPHVIDRSWRYVLRAMTLWHESSNSGGFWPIPATLIDSEGWGIPGFMSRLEETLYQQQNENPEGPTQQLQATTTVDMPQGVAQVLLALTRHTKAIEFAQREIDNGAEAILFRGIPNSLDDECDPTRSGSCPVEVTALRRSQKQIFLGQTIPDFETVDIALAGPAGRFHRQMDTHPPGASAELIAANRRETELQWNPSVNKLMVALDENGQGFIKGPVAPRHPAFMSTRANSTNILNNQPSSAMLPNFAYLEIDNQPPIFWFQRNRPVLEQEDRIVSTSKHNFYGPTPWMIQEPLCTQAIQPTIPSGAPAAGILHLLCNDLNFTPAMVAARETKFGPWTLENYTMDPFDSEERFQRTQTLPDPRGLEPRGWLTSDIMDAIVNHYNQLHPEAEIFSVSLTALLAVTGDPSHLAHSRLGARFWIFIQSNVRENQPGTHWWISIVDRVKGHFFSHNSLRGVGDPGILFDVLKPIFESPVVQRIAGSAATLTLPANSVVDIPQQQNGYDCGVFAVRTITAFLEGLAQTQGPVPTGGGSQAATSYIPESWSPTEYRGVLRSSFRIRGLQKFGTSTILNLLANLTILLSHINHSDHLERAMWHLDNTGGILLQIDRLTAGSMPLSCLCQNQDNGCGFSVVPVPPDYKVVLTSDSILSEGSWTRAQNLRVMQQHSTAYQSALTRLNRNNQLSNFQREELRDKCLILASDTTQVLVGSRLPPAGSHPQGFARAAFLPADNTDKIIQIMETNSKTYGGDTIRLPQVSYIRINDQLWIWITRSLARQAAGRWHAATTRRSAVLALTRANLFTLIPPTPAILNVRDEELEAPTIEDNPTNLASAMDSFNTKWAEKEQRYQQVTAQRPDYLPYSDSEDSLPYDGDAEEHYGVWPRKQKRFYHYSSSEEDEGGLTDRDRRTRPLKRVARMNAQTGTPFLPRMGPTTAEPIQPIRHLVRPSRDTRVMQIPEEIPEIDPNSGDPTLIINIISMLGRVLLLPTAHNFSYLSIRNYLERQRELFPASTLSYRMPGVDSTPFSSQSDYLVFHSQMYALPVEQRQGYIAVQQPMTWTTVMQFCTGNFVYERPQEPTRDWDAFMLRVEPLPADQVFAGYANLGGATFYPGPAATLQTREDFQRLFYSAAENEFPAIRVVIRRSLEVDSTDQAATYAARITATRFDGDSNNAIAGPLTAVVASPMDYMNWNFLSSLVTHWLGTSDSLTYVLPQSATQNPVAVDSQDSFQSMMDEFNRLPDGVRQLSLVIREPLVINEIARVRAEITAQEGELVTLQATGDPVATQRGQTRIDDLRRLLRAQLDAQRTRDRMAEFTRTRDLELTNERAAHAQEIIDANARARAATTRVAEARALTGSTAATAQVEVAALNVKLQKAMKQPEPARAAPAPTVQATVLDLSGLLARFQALADRVERMDESIQEGQRQATVRDRIMLDFIASFSSGSVGGGQGSRTAPDRPADQSTDQAADQAADQAPDQATGGSTQEVIVIVDGIKAITDEADDILRRFVPGYDPANLAQMAEEEEMEEDIGVTIEELEELEESGLNRILEGEEEEEGLDDPTPAELRAEGERVGDDGRRNHQREGRYYCPICGASVRTLGEARTMAHFTRCNIHYYHLVAERPVAKKGGKGY